MTNAATGLNLSTNNITGMSIYNGALDINFQISGTIPDATRYVDNPLTLLFGYGSSVHIPPFGGSDPSVYNSANGTFTSHIDSAWAFNPFGAVLHWLIDVRSNGAYRKPC